MTAAFIVSIVDDDPSVCESLLLLLRQHGYAARVFSSAEAFRQSDALPKTRCLLLDIAMPGMSGMDLQQELLHRGLRIPIIVITGQADDATRSTVLARGAVDFLIKPFDETALLAALARALGAP